jgi:hypothetical protein
MKDVKSHGDVCTTSASETDDAQIKMFEMAQEKDDYKSRYEELRQRVEQQQQEIAALHTELKWQQIQNKIFVEIIRTQTDIDMDNIIEAKENGSVHVYNYPEGNLPVIVHDAVKGTEGKTRKYTVTATKKKKKKVYRTVKNQAVLVHENLESREEKVREVEETMEEIVTQNFDGSRDSIVSELENLFRAVENSRTYSKSLQKMCFTRTQLLGLLSLEEYTELVKFHSSRLIDIFKGKNFQGKKLVTTVSKAFTPLDLRLLFYGGYYNMSVGLDNSQRLKLALDVTTVHPKEYVPFDKAEMYLQLRNYSIALFPLKECISRVLFNPYGFHTFIYFPLTKSTSKDPYSFYSLETVNKSGKRFWKMECRLEDFCHDFVSHVRSYCVFLFRKIYKDVFGDNDFREDFKTQSLIMHEDCEQLLQNIWAMSYPVTFRGIMKNLVRERATVQPTEMDKCHLSGDDKLQQRRLKSEKESTEEIMTVTRQLFDAITAEQVTVLYGS